MMVYMGAPCSHVEVFASTAATQRRLVKLPRAAVRIDLSSSVILYLVVVPSAVCLCAVLYFDFRWFACAPNLGWGKDGKPRGSLRVLRAVYIECVSSTIAYPRPCRAILPKLHEREENSWKNATHLFSLSPARVELFVPKRRKQKLLFMFLCFLVLT